MQDGVKLERKTKDELKQIAQGLGIEKISALNTDAIIALLREKREQIAHANQIFNPAVFRQQGCI